ncbi:MAG: carboxyl transferase domain-containing protein [Candidatus Methanoperedens sp.]|nr:carboxyl transferase domain-containing protein [Candidatus Methanoperedens sp.]
MTTALVVEDNILSREFLIDLLRMHGVIVQEAADGEEAVKKAQGSAYDLILMDINLPGMDGIEAARIIKTGQKDVLVIAVTAFAGRGDRERFLACGFDDYMPKPLEIPDFIKTLEKYCSLQKNSMDTQFVQKRFTALERIKKLLDPNSFVEIDGLAKHRCTDFGMGIKELPSDGVVTGFGTIDGKTIFVFSQDFAVKTYTGEDTTLGELGGAYVHGKISGLADFVAETEEDCLHRMRELLGLIMHPDSFFEDFEFDPHRLAESLVNVIPDDPMKSYDMYKLIRGVVDHGYLFDIKHDFSPNMITCLVRMAGQTVGIVANQPDVLAGSIDVDAADKAARFIRFCDSFNIPLITFVDVPGFLPGVEQEHRGIIRHGAKMLFAYSEATVPKITVIVRKAYGGAFLAMCSRKHIDAIIEPHQIRPHLIRALHMLRGKNVRRLDRKHGNIPV